MEPPLFKEVKREALDSETALKNSGAVPTWRKVCKAGDLTVHKSTKVPEYIAGVSLSSSCCDYKTEQNRTRWRQQHEETNTQITRQQQPCREGFCFGSQFKPTAHDTWEFMVTKSLRYPSSHIAPAARKEREKVPVSSCFLFLVTLRTPPHGMVLPTVKMDLFTSVNLTR